MARSLKISLNITIPSPKIGKERAVDYHAFFIRPKKKGAEGDNRSW
jgi:hypothetical protein